MLTRLCDKRLLMYKLWSTNIYSIFWLVLAITFNCSLKKYIEISLYSNIETINNALNILVLSKSKVTPYRTSSALTKATTKEKRNDNKTGEGFLIWEMSNKNCIMTILLLLTILVTVVEMIMDLFASFPFNVDCKEVYAKANCAEINFREERYSYNEPVFSRNVSTIVTESVL